MLWGALTCCACGHCCPSYYLISLPRCKGINKFCNTYYKKGRYFCANFKKMLKVCKTSRKGDFPQRIDFSPVCDKKSAIFSVTRKMRLCHNSVLVRFAQKSNKSHQINYNFIHLISNKLTYLLDLEKFERFLTLSVTLNFDTPSYPIPDNNDL